MVISLLRFRKECEVLHRSCLYVCLSVCLSARISQERHARNSRSFLYVLPVAVIDSFSDNNAIRYVPVAYPEFHSEGINLTKF